MENDKLEKHKKGQWKITKKISNDDRGYCKHGFKKSYFYIIALICIIILLFYLRKTILVNLEDKKISSAVSNEILNNIEYSSYTIEGKYNNKLTIRLNDSFDITDYSKLKELVQAITDKFYNIYSESEKNFENINYKKIHENTDKELTTNQTIIIIGNDSYEYSNQVLKKNGIEYTLQDSKIDRILKRINNSQLNNKQDLTEIINNTNFNDDVLNKILDSSDIENFKNEIIYQKALNLYNSGEFKESLKDFNYINSYSDSTDKINQLEILEKYQGTWEQTGDRIYRNKVIISKWKIYFLLADYNSKSTYYYSFLYTYDYELDGTELKRFYDDSNINLEQNYYLKNNILICPHDSLKNSTTELKKISDDITPPEVANAETPKIGMTKKEVEDSTWGKPEKINRTETIYGIREQWCYSRYRYIYFENGIVTSIQN